MGTRLPLFPLATVLVPGLVLPLHVFEPRYRELVERLMALPEGATRQFGVIALRAGAEGEGEGTGALHAVGCTAELREVTPYADGRFDIVSVGETRFRLTEIQQGEPDHALFEVPAGYTVEDGPPRPPRFDPPPPH